MNSRFAVHVVSLGLLLGLTGCTLFSAPVQTPDLTQVQQLTQLAATQFTTPSPTILVQLTLPAITMTPARPTPSRTPTAPSVTAAPPSPTAPCDQATAGNPIDITIADDTLVAPGQGFTKIWRLQNSGSCTWTRAYAARFFYGSQMEAPDVVFLTVDVLPGESVEIAIDMIAPQQPGTYQGNWKLRNTDGALFGIGPRGDSPFWVRVQVARQETATSTPTLTPVPSATPAPTATATLTPTATPEVQASGALTLTLTDAVDLDSGVINSLSSEDVAYRKDASGFHLLIPLDSAQLGIFGASEPTPPDCWAANMSSAPLTLESLPNQAFLCYLTDRGRSGWLRFDGLDAETDQVNLYFWTWQQP